VYYNTPRALYSSIIVQIEGELNAPDRVVEGLVGEFGDDGSGFGSSSSLLPLDDDLTAT
jgi:hypothetical protein